MLCEPVAGADHMEPDPTMLNLNLSVIENAVRQRDAKGMRNRVKDIRIAEQIGTTYIDSADDTPLTISDTVRGVRQYLSTHLYCKDADPLVIYTGTDSLYKLAFAIAEGVAPEELGMSSVVLTASLRAPHERNTDAFYNPATAMLAAVSDEMRGRIGVAVGGQILAPRGLVKVGDLPFQSDFSSRFTPMGYFGERTLGSKISPFTDSSMAYQIYGTQADKPTGTEGLHFGMEEGVTSMDLEADTNYAAVGDIIRGNRASHTKAMLLMAPGNGNIKQQETQVLVGAAQEAEQLGMPVVLSGQIIQHAKVASPQERDLPVSMYPGNGEHIGAPIISAGELTKGEAKNLLSILLYQAHLLPGTGPEIVARIRAGFERYKNRYTRMELHPLGSSGRAVGYGSSSSSSSGSGSEQIAG